MVRHLLAVVAVALGGCGTTQFGGVVIVEPQPITLSANTPALFEAQIRLNDGSTLPDTHVVSATVSWHAPPDQSRPKQILNVTRAGPTKFTAYLQPAKLRAAQLVDVRWIVEGTSNNVLRDVTDTHQVDCPDGPEPFLRSMQSAVVARFGSLTTGGQLLAAGYVLNNHGWAQMDGMGVTFVHPNPVLDPATPPLLIFNAAPGANITDTLPDAPLTLVGWGYGVFDVVPGLPRPTFGCVPYHEWFLHEAGWHTPNDGGMVLDPPPPQGPLLVPPTTRRNLARAGGANESHYHPRIWDLHFWSDPSGLPRMSLVNANGPTAATPPPAGIFFYPPMPD